MNSVWTRGVVEWTCQEEGYMGVDYAGMFGNLSWHQPRKLPMPNSWVWVEPGPFLEDDSTSTLENTLVKWLSVSKTHVTRKAKW